MFPEETSRARLTTGTASARNDAADVAFSEFSSSQGSPFEGQIQQTMPSLETAPPDFCREIESLTDLAKTEDVLARLQSVSWSFTDADTGYLSHDIHPYPAKFIPQPGSSFDYAQDFGSRLIRLLDASTSLDKNKNVSLRMTTLGKEGQAERHPL